MMPPSGALRLRRPRTREREIGASQGVDLFGLEPPWEGERSDFELDRDAARWGSAVATSQPSSTRFQRWLWKAEK